MLLLCKRYEHFKEKNVYIKLADRPQCFRRSCFGFFLRVLFASFHFKRRISKNSPFFIIPVVCTLVDERECRYVNKALVTIKYHENMTSRDFKIDTLCNAVKNKMCLISKATLYPTMLVCFWIWMI